MEMNNKLFLEILKQNFQKCYFHCNAKKERRRKEWMDRSDWIARRELWSNETKNIGVLWTAAWENDHFYANTLTKYLTELNYPFRNWWIYSQYIYHIFSYFSY